MLKNILIIFIALIVTTMTSNEVSAKMLRWQKMPIKVCVPTNQYAPLMKKAFSEWTKVTNGKVKFQYTCAQPEITISYSPNKKRSLTTYSFTGDNYIYKSHIEIALLTQQGRKMEDDVLVLLMEHEIAHALGISGHTNTPKSIMQPVVQAGYTITADTIAEINKRYK